MKFGIERCVYILLNEILINNRILVRDNGYRSEEK